MLPALAGRKAALPFFPFCLLQLQIYIYTKMPNRVIPKRSSINNLSRHDRRCSKSGNATTTAAAPSRPLLPSYFLTPLMHHNRLPLSQSVRMETSREGGCGAITDSHTLRFCTLPSAIDAESMYAQGSRGPSIS